MSIATQISRLTTLRNNIRTKLIALGIISNSSADLEDCYDAINGITAKSAATYTPTTTAQSIAAGQYLTGDQTIAGDSNLIGSNILSSASIFGVQGTYVPYLEFTSKSVAANAFVSDATYAQYPYRAAIACSGATSDMFVYVEFSEADMESGYFSETAASYNGGVYIYALGAKAATISKITFYRRS